MNLSSLLVYYSLELHTFGQTEKSMKTFGFKAYAQQICLFLVKNPDNTARLQKLFAKSADSQKFFSLDV